MADTGDAAGQDGYFWLAAPVPGAMLMIESVAGAPDIKFFTPIGSMVTGRNKYRITRSATNVFTTYIQDGSGWEVVDATGGVGTNPFTDATVITSKYLTFALEAGDHIYKDVQFAGVVPPV